MIIFGIRSYSTVLGRLTQTCQKCGVNCAQTIVQLKRKFTLFFIPLIPIGTSHVMICTSCTSRFKMTDVQVTQFNEALATKAPMVSEQFPPSNPASRAGRKPLIAS
jgi:hypothetical protein